jgi:hypothetical protein
LGSATSAEVRALVDGGIKPTDINWTCAAPIRWTAFKKWFPMVTE